MKVLLWPSENPCLDHNVLFWHDLKPAVNAQKPYCGWIKTIPQQQSERLSATYEKCLIAVPAAKGGQLLIINNQLLCLGTNMGETCRCDKYAKVWY